VESRGRPRRERRRDVDETDESDGGSQEKDRKRAPPEKIALALVSTFFAVFS
jgi:hypothetical protein